MQTGEMLAPDSGSIAGFWRRVLAIFLDGLVLGLIGFCLGLFPFDFLAGIGGWGQVLGFAVALVYFGVMNSQVCGGRTSRQSLHDLAVGS